MQAVAASVHTANATSMSQAQLQHTSATGSLCSLRMSCKEQHLHNQQVLADVLQKQYVHLYFVILWLMFVPCST